MPRERPIDTPRELPPLRPRDPRLEEKKKPLELLDTPVSKPTLRMHTLPPRTSSPKKRKLVTTFQETLPKKKRTDCVDL
mgnify:CR=1 FL=1